MSKIASESLPPLPSQPTPVANRPSDTDGFADRLSDAARRAGDQPAEPAADPGEQDDPPHTAAPTGDADREHTGEQPPQPVRETPQKESDTQDDAETVVAVDLNDVVIIAEEQVAAAATTTETPPTAVQPTAPATPTTHGAPGADAPPDAAAFDLATPAEAERPDQPSAGQPNAGESASTAPQAPQTDAPVAPAATDVLPKASETTTAVESPQPSPPEDSRPAVAAAEAATPQDNHQEATGEDGQDQVRQQTAALRDGQTPELQADLNPETADAADAAADARPDEKPAAPAEVKPETTRPATASLDRVADRLTAARGAEEPPAPVESRVDASRFVSRVSRAFEAAHSRGDEVRLRLSPPELGAMQIKLSVNAEGAMHASVETETSAARSVLLDNLPALRDRLASMDIRVEKFDVNVGGQGGGQPDWRAGEESQDGRPRRDGNQQDHGREATEPTPASRGGVRPLGAVGPDQINLVA